jgi:hypothetical protein
MKSVNKEILGFNVPVSGVVETLDEAVLAAGSPERVVDMFNNYVLFHQHFGKIRTAVVKKLEELTSKPRTQDTEGNVDEKDSEYIARLEEEGVNLSEFESVIGELVAGMPVDYKQPVRGSGGSSTVAKKWLAAVDTLIEEGKYERFVAKYKLDFDGLSEDEQKQVAARKVKEVITNAQRAALAAATAEIA